MKVVLRNALTQKFDITSLKMKLSIRWMRNSLAARFLSVVLSITSTIPSPINKIKQKQDRFKTSLKIAARVRLLTQVFVIWL